MNSEKSKDEPQSIKEVLRDFVAQKPLQKGVEKVRICNAWGEIMGEHIKKYTSETRFSYNILYVNLRSAPLKAELQYRLPEITVRLNEYLGGEFVNKIVLV